MYNAYITRLKNLRKHSNADRLLCGMCFESHVIVGLDMNETDLVVFFPTDGQLNQEFAEKNNLVRKNDENGNNIGGYLDANKRNIKSVKLRGEMSDGLVMPLDCLKEYTDITQLKDGDTISVLNGVEICCKYIPSRGSKSIQNPTNVKNKQKVTEIYPYFAEHIDTAQLQYNLRNFHEGDLVTISLKMHGTSHRESIAIEEKERKRNFLQKLFHKKPVIDKSWKPVAGSRRVVLKSFDGGFYGSNSFRAKYHELFADKLHHGETVYLEIIGFIGETPIMGSVGNSKVSDKAFTKKFGKETVFSYGCEKGQNECYVYRMTMTNDQGVVTEYPTWYVKLRCEQMGVNFVPVLDQFFFSTEEDLMWRVNAILEGDDGMPSDIVGKTHILEGVVVRIENRSKFTAYKHKNFYFKVLEGIAKDEAVEADIEEAEELIGE